uniref:Uncharacterized protein n=1 Tax=Hemiselmis andersenii TaxID=464988 RepID=A0A6T8N7S8_HEMAN|mmetsp:Transcript_36359/g.85317  ORF Transcript_36359/g.85317 Transcript_36359/m.85317 type:complete len:557 (-) Transcript_36359:3089-4759(-)|eukprot:CAMPEP_0169484032 /NCGR_PEP_ID=MMETSP1042-20121227/31526_1 /TAXON_ID=464988 /ORGANISM="Hemiselmis andersenii, Strain CCMP1180" /LENGTH=556 /DNA_ID=CAMNT_0009599007 /DNA_START=113 /DNA_END=1783 /DNA_ORIENTATION=+
MRGGFGALLLLLLLSVCCRVADAAPPQLQDTKFALTFHVQKDQFDQALAETTALVEHAEANAMSKNTIMLLRAARDKVAAALDDLQKRIKEEERMEALKKTQAPAPASFTDALIGVKALKSDGAKKCNIKKYPSTEIGALLEAGKVDLKKPFIVTGGVPGLESQKALFTADILMKNTVSQLRYLSPVKAKERRTFDQQQQQVPDDEQLEYSMVSVEKYFVNCFNHKAKPDFRKSGGADTEHCEQQVPAAYLSNSSEGFRFTTTAGTLGWLQKLDQGRSEFLSRVQDLQPLVNPKVELTGTLARGASRYIVFGPAGSGEQLRQEGVPFIDGLVHGKRRWFLMSPKDFVNLRDKAADVLEPASAFMFFEQQLEELVEDHGLGGKKMKFWECNQNAGEMIYIPGDTIMTSLSLVDSFSHKHHVATTMSGVLAKVNSAIWAPETGQIPYAFQYASCFDGVDLIRAGETLGSSINPMQSQIIGQIMNQYYGSPESRNMLIINVLSECTAVFRADGLDAAKSFCPRVWGQCVGQLEANAKKIGKSVPGWVTKDPPKSGKQEL